MSTDLTALGMNRMPPVVALAATVPLSPNHQAAPAKDTAGANSLAQEHKPAKDQMRENIREATAKINQQMQIRGRKLSFEIDDETNQIVVTVKDINTGDVIRQIPSEALLRVAHNIDQIKGLLHNELT